jgi:quercetin dioxygenase-like cupin family protein
MAMQIIRVTDAKRQPSDNPAFVGPVLTQDIVSDEMAQVLRVTEVTFAAGARNKWHMHAADQVLIVTAGRGIIATEAEERTIVPGDVVLIPAGEKHWHGATTETSMTHFAVLTPGPMTVFE